MIQGAETPASSSDTTHSARELLIGWANQQDGWVRLIVGEVVATRRELSEAEVTEARDCYLAEKQLAQGQVPNIPALAASGEDDTRAEALLLVSLRNCRGVNALAEDQEITFHPRLTVLFGENAMGKTGYVRVLKRLANVRSAEPIIPDIHRPSAPTGPHAVVRYALGDSQEELNWQGQAGVSPFTRITVFDSPAVALHLESSMTYVFTPADLALFRYTHAAIEGVRSLLEADAAATQPRQNPFLTAFARGTPVYAEIEALSASTSVARLTELATVSDTERAELDTLRASVEALETAGSGGRTEMMRSRSVVLEHLVSLAEAIGRFEHSAYDEAVDDKLQAERFQEEAAEAAYGRGQLSPDLLPSWQAFLEAAERHLIAGSRLDYPHPGDDCIYCAQPLGDASRALIAAYRQYASGGGAGAVAEAHDRVVSCDQIRARGTERAPAEPRGE